MRAPGRLAAETRVGQKLKLGLGHFYVQRRGPRTATSCLTCGLYFYDAGGETWGPEKRDVPCYKGRLLDGLERFQPIDFPFEFRTEMGDAKGTWALVVRVTDTVLGDGIDAGPDVSDPAAMMAVMPWLVASTAVFMAANAALKAYAQGGGYGVLAGALALFCLGNTLMVQVMRGNGLGLAIALSVVFQMVAITVMALVVFDERPAPMQWAGVALGVVAVLLIALGQREAA